MEKLGSIEFGFRQRIDWNREFAFCHVCRRSFAGQFHNPADGLGIVVGFSAFPANSRRDVFDGDQPTACPEHRSDNVFIGRRFTVLASQVTWTFRTLDRGHLNAGQRKHRHAQFAFRIGRGTRQHSFDSPCCFFVERLFSARFTDPRRDVLDGRQSPIRPERSRNDSFSRVSSTALTRGRRLMQAVRLGFQRQFTLSPVSLQPQRCRRRSLSCS